MQEIKFSTHNAIRDIFLDLQAYVAEVFGGNPDDIMLNWNAVGACIHYFDADHVIQFRLWERSQGHLGIPDMTLIVINISFRGKQEEANANLNAFVRWLRLTARINGFRYLADENIAPLATDQVPGCQIACFPL